MKYVAERRKKVIVLGIPKMITTDEIKQKIKEEFGEDVADNLHKELTRPTSKSYQLMLDLDEALASKLLKKGRLLVGFLSCPIKMYAPIIRCNNCQLFGHTSEKCRREQACAYCTKNHDSENCTIKNSTRRHTCINCLHSYDSIGRPYDNNHAANSTKCYRYQYIFQQRNLATNRITRNSI